MSTLYTLFKFVLIVGAIGWLAGVATFSILKDVFGNTRLH